MSIVAPFLTMNTISAINLQTARDTATFAVSRLDLLKRQRTSTDALLRAMRGH